MKTLSLRYFFILAAMILFGFSTLAFGEPPSGGRAQVGEPVPVIPDETASDVEALAGSTTVPISIDPAALKKVASITESVVEKEKERAILGLNESPETGKLKEDEEGKPASSPSGLGRDFWMVLEPAQIVVSKISKSLEEKAEEKTETIEGKLEVREHHIRGMKFFRRWVVKKENGELIPLVSNLNLLGAVNEPKVLDSLVAIVGRWKQAKTEAGTKFFAPERVSAIDAFTASYSGLLGSWSVGLASGSSDGTASGTGSKFVEYVPPEEVMPQKGAAEVKGSSKDEKILVNDRLVPPSTETEHQDPEKKK